MSITTDTTTAVTGIPRTKCPRPVYIDFSVFTSYYAHIYCMPGYTFNHFPASTHRAVEATRSPLIVTAPFLQMEKLLPEHPATSTFDHL